MVKAGVAAAVGTGGSGGGGLVDAGRARWTAATVFDDDWGRVGRVDVHFDHGDSGLEGVSESDDKLRQTAAHPGTEVVASHVYPVVVQTISLSIHISSAGLRSL